MSLDDAKSGSIYLALASDGIHSKRRFRLSDGTGVNGYIAAMNRCGWQTRPCDDTVC